MENYKELVVIMLPEGILEYFEFVNLSRTPHSYTITLEEKNKSHLKQK